MGEELGGSVGTVGAWGVELILGVPVEEVEGPGRGGVGHPRGQVGPQRAGDAPALFQASGL